MMGTTICHVYRIIRAALSAIALAFFAHVVPAHAQGDAAPVRVDGRVVFRVGATSSDDAEARARAVERRIATLVERPELIEPARVVPGADPETRAVTVAGAPLVTVTAADAEDNLTTVDTLAAAWAEAATAALERARDRRLSWWGRFVTEVRAAVETAFGRLAESSVRIIPRALAALLVVGLFWALASGVRRLMRAVFARVVSDLTAENLVKQVAYYTVWALGLVVAADALVSSRVRELGSDDVVVEVRFWCDAQRRDFVATASAVRMAVVAALKREGVGLPDPAVRAIVPRDLDRWREAVGPSAGVFLVIQTIESYVLMPFVNKRAVALLPAVTISAQILMGVLVGGLGVLFATPLVLSATVLVKMLYLEDALGEDVTLPSETGGDS